MMLIADTRPNSRGGVTDCRKVVVLMTHRIGPTPSRKKLKPASHGEGMKGVSAITAGGKTRGVRTTPHRAPEGEPPHHPCRQQRADHHAGTEHRKRHADACR